MPRASTPCIRVCLLDPETGLCEGCGRTAAEIGGWGGMSEDDRLAVMAGLEARMRTAFLPADPPSGPADPPAGPADPPSERAP